MFRFQMRLEFRVLQESLLPAPEFAQKQVSVVAGLADVVKNSGATFFARIVNDEVAKAQHALGDAGIYGHVLNLTKRNISCPACYQSRVNLHLRIGQCVAHGISPHVVVRWKQKQRKAKQN